jgi:hypothetical protein
MISNMLVYDKQTMFSLFGGMREDLRRVSHVGVFLLDRMIRDAHQMGLNYDFEGSVLPGVEYFMRSFGGELHPLYRVVKFPSPLSYLVWHGYRYLTKHRRRWVWYD